MGRFQGIILDQKYREKACMAIASRTRPLAFVYLLLFLSIFIGTQMTPKQFSIAQNFAIYISVLAVALFALSTRIMSHPSDVLRRVFYVAILLVGLSWGAFCYYIQFSIALGWTSFIVVLLTLLIAASQLASLVPDFRVLLVFQSFLLVPSFFLNIWQIGGSQGFMMGSFFLGYWVLLVLLGWIQYQQHWTAVRNHERVESVIDNMPGFLALIDGDKKWARVNQKLSETLEKTPASLAGQAISEAPDFIKGFIQRIYQNTGERQSGLVEKARKKYLFTGQSSEERHETILLGVDVTDQHLVQDQLEFQRAQSQTSARFAGLGEVIANISKSLPSKAQDDVEGVQRAWPLIHRLATGHGQTERSDVNIVDVLEETVSFFGPRAKEKSTELKFEKSVGSALCEVRQGDVLLSLMNLLNNSMEAVETQDVRKVELSVWIKDNICIEVSDSGPGVPEHFTDVVFEPNFTTKKAQESTGLGLSLSRQLIESNGGSLSLENRQNPTRFRIELPAK